SAEEDRSRPGATDQGVRPAGTDSGAGWPARADHDLVGLARHHGHDGALVGAGAPATSAGQAATATVAPAAARAPRLHDDAPAPAAPDGPAGPGRPAGPAGPLPPWPTRLTSSWGSWLVPVFSLLSNATPIPAAFGRSTMPLFSSARSSQSRTRSVRSTRTKVF